MGSQCRICGKSVNKILLNVHYCARHSGTQLSESNSNEAPLQQLKENIRVPSFGGKDIHDIKKRKGNLTFEERRRKELFL